MAAGTGAQDRGFCGHASHDPVKIMVSEGLVVGLQQRANWLQLWILGFGPLRNPSGGSLAVCDCQLLHTRVFEAERPSINCDKP
jgi:hypothetical protein